MLTLAKHKNKVIQRFNALGPLHLCTTFIRFSNASTHRADYLHFKLFSEFPESPFLNVLTLSHITQEKNRPRHPDPKLNGLVLTSGKNSLPRVAFKILSELTGA